MMKKIISLSILLIFALLFSLNSYSDIGKIKYPIYSFPEIVKRGDSFEVKLEEKENLGNLKFLLSLKYGYEIDLSILSQNYDKEKSLWSFKLSVPENTPLELYDLKVIYDNKEEVSEKAVKVIDEYKKSFYIVHISDIHIGFPGNYVSQGYPDSSTILRKIAEEMNLINPEFVLITGDIVSSTEDITRIFMYYNKPYMDTTKEKLVKIVEDEYNEFLNILSLFEVPVFIVPGNHEMVGIINKISISFYEKKIGKRYYSFDYGDCHFIGIDNSNMMEAINFCYGGGGGDIDEEQLNWLKEDLERNKDKKLKVVFFHVPIHNLGCKFKDVIKEYNVDLGLCGHMHQDFVLSRARPILIQTKAVLDFGGYRLVRIKEGEIFSYNYGQDKKESNSSGKIKISFSPENNGKNKKVKAIIENQQIEDFEDAILKFLMPKKKKYNVKGGEIFQIIEGKNYNIVYVKIFVKRSSKIEVEIK